MFKVAILQKRAINAQIDKNIESIIMAMKEASENRADILLLPECFVTGYDLPMTYEKSIADDDIRIVKICENAKKYQIGVVLTAFTKGNSQPQNSAFVINKSGDILMKYSKVHTCDFADERNVESGKEFKVCDFEGIQLGIMICYDREYPESARILMLKGAEVILVPNDCGSMQPRINALSTRAYENMVAVAMANPNGDNAGCSCAYSPICWDRNGKCVDNTVLLADDKTEGIFYAKFDVEAIREYRNREMLGNTFRKVEAYSQLLSKEIKEPFVRDDFKKIVDKNQVLTNPKKLVTLELKNQGLDIDKIKVPERVYLLADSLYDEMVSKNCGTYQYHLGGELYVFRANENVGFVKGNMCSPAIATQAEDLIAGGVKELIHIGLAGGLQKDMKPGDIVVTDGAYNDTAVARLYGYDLDFIESSKKLTDEMCQILTSKNIAYRREKHWTTDAGYMETWGQVMEYRDKGASCVEMEGVGLFTVALYRKCRATAIYVISDVYVESDWKLGWSEKQLENAAYNILETILSSI